MLKMAFDWLEVPLDQAAPLPFLMICAAVFGCCLGSFLNVCIWRIPLGESIVFVPSHCPKCHHPIRWFDNVPIFGYLALRGRCRDCHAPISPRYILVEAGVGLLYTLLTLNAYYAGSALALTIFHTIVIAVAVPCMFIDVEHRKLPDKLTRFGMIAGVLWQGLFPVGGRVLTHPQGVLWGLAGMLAGLIGLGLFAWATGKLFRRRTMGAGDVKYAGFAGAAFGWPGLLLILCVGSILALAGYGVLRLMRKRPGDGTVAFGLYLGLAVLLWSFVRPWLAIYGV